MEAFIDFGGGIFLNKTNKITASLWILGVSVYLIVSFAFDVWHISWVIFPIVAFINIAIKLYFSQKNNGPKTLWELLRNRDFSIPAIWMFAVWIYLILGFVFDLWHPSWIVFILAVVPTILL